jgi:hypothetical protein
MGKASKRVIETFGDIYLNYLYIHVIIDQFYLKLSLSTSYDLSLVYCKALTVVTILLFNELSFGVKSYSELLVN